MSLWQRPNGPQSIAASPTSQAGLNVQGAPVAMPPATLVLGGTTETVVAHPQNSAIAYVCILSPNQGNEQVPFDLVASGYVTTTNTTNITIKIYSGTSLTVGSDTLLGASSAVAVNTAKCPWEVHLHLIYDSVSGKMQGYIEGLLNNTLITKAAISATLTGINDLNNPVANFVISCTSSASTGPLPATFVVKNFTVG